ncbi:MAG: M20/M25/M40 family metallo-hydrolase [Chitinophagaceae bacterium]
MTLLKPISIALLISHAAFSQDTALQESMKVVLDKRYENEINTLAKLPSVKSAFQSIIDFEPQTQADLITLTEIPAPPFKETERGMKFKEMLEAAGADTVWIDQVGNVIARRKGKSGKKTVVIEAHLDTVFPEGTDVKVKRKGDTLYAPGISDDTRGLAVLLAMLKSIKKANIQTDADILFIGTVGEEGLGDLRGVKHLFSDKGPKIDAYISVEPGVERITHRGLGSHRYRVRFKGPGGHSSGAFGTVNPHGALGRAIYYFTGEADKFTREGIATTYNVGVIGGGTSVNSIPFESWMEVDMRSESSERLNGIDQLFQAAIQRAVKEENQMKRRGADLTVDVKSVGDRPSGGNDPGIAVVQRAIAATKYIKEEPRLGAGSTNSNIPFSKNIPAVTIGSGGVSGGFHALNEWWLNDKGYLSIQRTMLTLLAEAGVSK